MFLYQLFVLILFIYVSTQTDDKGKCKIWGDPHLMCFPANRFDTHQEGYRCQWQGRVLIVENPFIQLYINFTASPYWNEYYEIYLFYNATKICTITPDIENCDSPSIEIVPPTRDSPNTKHIFYDYSDNEYIDILVNTILVNGRYVAYDIEVIQSHSLIENSTGLCINRARRCYLESTARRKRSTSENKATEVCDLFINKSRDAAQQLVNSGRNLPMNLAREACITDILTTNDPAWGQSAAWFVLTDYVREASLSRSQQEAMLNQVPALIAEVAATVKVDVEAILEISTTTSPSNNATLSNETLATITSPSTDHSSSSQTPVTSPRSSALNLKLSRLMLPSMFWLLWNRFSTNQYK